jgi:prepilin-type N-terminal cleavage/methylation domain-containing protein
MRRGFSLLEVMVATLVSVIVVSGLYALFRVQVRQFVYQDLQAGMHRQDRLAIDVLGRTARAAGYGAAGVTRGALGEGGDANNPMPAVIAYDAFGADGSDAVTLVSMDPELRMETSAAITAPCTTTELSFEMGVRGNAAAIVQYVAGDRVMCIDQAASTGQVSYLWNVTGDGSSASGTIGVEDATVYADFSATCPPTSTLPVSMTCSRAEIATFYIDADGTDGVGAGSAEHPVLMLDLDFEFPDDDDLPVVDDIEDLQVQYCLDTADCATDPAGGTWADSIDSYTDADPDNDADDVLAIRISVVARSARTDPADLVPGAPIALANHDPGSTADHYFRTASSTDLVARNLRFQSTSVTSAAASP